MKVRRGAAKPLILITEESAPASGFRVQGSGFRVQGSGFRVQGSGFRVYTFERDVVSELDGDGVFLEPGTGLRLEA